MVDRREGPAIVAVLDDGARLSLLDARTGKPIWEAAPPAQMIWSDYGVDKGAEFLVAQAWSKGLRSLVMLRAADGAVVWERPSWGDFEIKLGLDGTGLFAYREKGCTSQLIDPTTGKDFAQPFKSPTYVERSLVDRSPPDERCSSSVDLLGFARGRGVVAHQDRGAQRAWIEGHPAAAGVSGWTIPLGDGMFAPMYREPRTGVTWTFSGEIMAMGLDLDAGRQVWAWREGYDHSSCTDSPYPPLRSVPGPVGHDPALLFQDCVKVEMVDARTGALLWRRDRGGASAVIEGEISSREALPRAGYGQAAYQFWSSAGVAGARVRAPEDARAVFAHPEGLLIQGERYVALEDRGGAFRWYVRVDGWIARVSEGLVVVSMSGDSKGLVLVDPRDGAALGVARGELAMIGAAPAESARAEVLVVMDTGSFPHGLRALGVPSDAR